MEIDLTSQEVEVLALLSAIVLKGGQVDIGAAIHPTWFTRLDEAHAKLIKAMEESQ